MIYEPKGKAREYAPLALNLYTHCGHGCTYCYAPKALKKSAAEYFVPNAASRSTTDLEKGIKRYRNSPKPVHLSFVGDSYDMSRIDNSLTRRTLELCLEYQVPVQVLSKGGTRCLSDMDLFQKFGQHIRVGQSLTFWNLDKSRVYEPRAADPEDRLDALQILKENGVQTWASFEPVIEPSQSLMLLSECLEYGLVDYYTIGAVSGISVTKSVDWEAFLEVAIGVLNLYKVEFYIKENLRKLAPNAAQKLTEKQADMDANWVLPFEKNGLANGTNCGENGLENSKNRNENGSENNGSGSKNSGKTIPETGSLF